METRSPSSAETHITYCITSWPHPNISPLGQKYSRFQEIHHYDLNNFITQSRGQHSSSHITNFFFAMARSDHHNIVTMVTCLPTLKSNKTLNKLKHSSELPPDNLFPEFTDCPWSSGPWYTALSWSYQL